MKKVGLLTYHNAINYGAVLQAYALSRKINEIGADCKIIDYRCPAVEMQYIFKGFRKCTSWKNFIAHNLTCALRIKKKKRFKAFVSKMPLTREYERAELENNAMFDVCVVGSDQVFNPVCNKSDPTYFLDFARSAKKAYAASLGSINQFESSKINTLELLKEFDSLSFREKDAAAYMSEKLGKECTTVLDPVWLLEKQNWSSVARSPKNKPYIFVYNLMDYGFMKNFVEELKRKTGLSVIVVNRTIKGDVAYLSVAKNCSNCSPEEFLGYIRDAEYVVTDSFHGTSFSMIFEKKFFVAMNPSSNNTNSRMENILELADLHSRKIDGDSILKTEDEIDYIQVKRRIAPEIESSLEYLKSMF